jgi:hypothetical protein
MKITLPVGYDCKEVLGMHEGKHGILEGVEDLDELFGDDEHKEKSDKTRREHEHEHSHL